MDLPTVTGTAETKPDMLRGGERLEWWFETKGSIEEQGARGARLAADFLASIPPPPPPGVNGGLGSTSPKAGEPAGSWMPTTNLKIIATTRTKEGEMGIAQALF